MTATATRIIFTPWQEQDGQWRTHDEIVEPPNAVEIEAGWVHIIVREGFDGISRRRLRSHPANVIDCVIWENA